MPVWPALAGAACQQRLPAILFALHLNRQGSPTNRASLKLLVGAKCMQTGCLSGWPALAGEACQQRMPPCSLLCTGTVKDLRPIKASLWLLCKANFVVCESVLSGCKLFVCLAGTRRSCVRTKADALLFALHRSRQGSPTNQSKLVAARRCVVHAKLFACLAGTRRSCLRTKAAALLFALHRSRQRSPTNQSKLAASALRCVVHAICLPV